MGVIVHRYSLLPLQRSQQWANVVRPHAICRIPRVGICWKRRLVASLPLWIIVAALPAQMMSPATDFSRCKHLVESLPFPPKWTVQAACKMTCDLSRQRGHASVKSYIILLPIVLCFISVLSPTIREVVTKQLPPVNICHRGGGLANGINSAFLVI